MMMMMMMEAITLSSFNYWHLVITVPDDGLVFKLPINLTCHIIFCVMLNGRSMIIIILISLPISFMF